MTSTDFDNLRDFVSAVTCKAVELGEKAKSEDGCVLDVEFQPIKNGKHEPGPVFRYLPSNRAELLEENERLKEEIKTLKREANKRKAED